MRILRGEVAIDEPIVGTKRGPVVVPVHGHREGVADGESEKGASGAGGEVGGIGHGLPRTTTGGAVLVDTGVAKSGRLGKSVSGLQPFRNF